MRNAACWTVCGLLIGLTAPASAQFALHNGDRVVFYGDSITDNAPYTTFIETFVLTRFPKMNVRFFNAGVGGDRVTGGGLGPVDDRLTRDLFSRKPTVITIMLGMNDGGYQAFRQDLFDTYKNGLAHIADRIHAEAPVARVWLIEPSPFDDFTRPSSGYNEVLKKYGAAVADLAKDRGYGVVDLNAPVAEALQRAAATDPVVAQRILNDRVHPWIAGHLVMAANVLKAWGAPSLVSRTDIDAATGRSNAVGASVRDIHTGDAVSWTSLEDSLPYPIDRKDETTALILRTSPIEDLIGREIILVHKLAPGNYKLSIDGQLIGQFPSDIFNSGIDLAWQDTPMTKQSLRVVDWTQKRVAMKYFAWRSLEFGLSSITAKSRTEAVHAIDRLEEDVVRRQHEEAIPKPHTFEVTKA
jgi:lysophospholipase L1-like esterase